MKLKFENKYKIVVRTHERLLGVITQGYYEGPGKQSWQFTLQIEMRKKRAANINLNIICGLIIAAIVAGVIYIFSL